MAGHVSVVSQRGPDDVRMLSWLLMGLAGLGASVAIFTAPASAADAGTDSSSSSASNADKAGTAGKRATNRSADSSGAVGRRAVNGRVAQPPLASRPGGARVAGPAVDYDGVGADPSSVPQKLAQSAVEPMHTTVPTAAVSAAASVALRPVAAAPAVVGVPLEPAAAVSVASEPVGSTAAVSPVEGVPVQPAAAVPVAARSAAAKSAATRTQNFGWATATATPTGIKPEGMVVSSDGKTIYVANNLSDTVSVINAADGTKIRDIRIYTPRWFQWGYQGKEPSKLALSEDDKYLYVVNRGGKGNELAEKFAGPLAMILQTPSLSVVDISNGYKVASARISTLSPLSELAAFAIRQEVTGIAVGNGKLYLSDANNRNPSFGSLRGGEVEWNRYEVVERLVKEVLQCTTQRCPYYEAGQMGAWSTIKSYTIPLLGKVIDAATAVLPFHLDKIVKFSDLLAVRPADIAVAPDGGLNYVYSVNRANDLVYVFDPVTNVMVDAVYLGQMKLEDKTLYLGNGTTPIKMKFSPDGQTGYVLNANTSELVRLDTDPSKIKSGRGVQVIDRTIVNDNAGLRPVDMAVTADGRYAIVLNELSRFFPDQITSSLTIVDLTDNKVVSSLPLYRPADNVEVLELSLVGTKAFITTRSTKAFVANTRAGDVISIDIPSSAFIPKP